ncbi:DinB family protein [soil metagenome]
MSTIGWPDDAEYAPFYRSYVAAARNIAAGVEGPVVVLRDQLTRINRLSNPEVERRRGFSYAPGKWTVADLVGHLADSERVFAYRAMRIARADSTPLPGFDQDSYVVAGSAVDAPFSSLAAELSTLRRASILLFENMPITASAARGNANDAAVTPRALAAIMAGHVEHHLNVLETQYEVVTSRT